MSSYIEIIKNQLSFLEPVRLELINESYKHKGHGGWNETGATHFHLRIVSNHFVGKSKIQRHQMIYKLLIEQLKSQVHALGIEALTEEEYLACGFANNG